MKKTILFLIVVILIIGACGCMKFEKSVSVEEIMVEKMNEKYSDDTFYYNRPFGGGAGVYSKKIVVTSEKYPDRDIFVMYADNTFTDNYLSIKYYQKTKKLLVDIVKQAVLCDYLLIYEPQNYACPNEQGDMSFEAYIKNKDSCIAFTLFLKEVDFDKISFAERLEKLVVDAGICCMGTIYFDGGDVDFDSLVSGDLVGYLFKKSYNDVFTFTMDDNKAFKTSCWGE